MYELEKKFREYLINNWLFVDQLRNQMAKDLTEIATKMFKHIHNVNVELQQENTALKKQISNQKYLNRDEVEKEIWKFYDIIKYQLLEYSFIKGNIEKTTGNILLHPIKPTREHIIEVLGEFFKNTTLMANKDVPKDREKYPVLSFGKVAFNHIASEILGEEREDE